MSERLKKELDDINEKLPQLEKEIEEKEEVLNSIKEKYEKLAAEKQELEDFIYKRDRPKTETKKEELVKQEEEDDETGFLNLPSPEKKYKFSSTYTPRLKPVPEFDLEQFKKPKIEEFTEPGYTPQSHVKSPQFTAPQQPRVQQSLSPPNPGQGYYQPPYYPPQQQYSGQPASRSPPSPPPPPGLPDKLFAFVRKYWVVLVLLGIAGYFIYTQFIA